MTFQETVTEDFTREVRAMRLEKVRTVSKTKLNLACGNRVMDSETWYNHDRWAHRPEVDQVHDLEVHPWPWPTSAFNEVFAWDILEHVQRPMLFIEELWRISAPDAHLVVHTSWAGPQSDARGVWRDPQHVRPFHEESFCYFDPIRGGFWFENYGKFYSPARFEVKEIQKNPPDCIGFILRAIKE